MFDGYEMFVLSSRLQETTEYTVRKERGKLHSTLLENVNDDAIA